jgi:hypothetical protein
MQEYPTLSVQDAFIVASGLTQSTNTVPATWEIRGNFGPQEIMRSVQLIVDAHESLRTKIAQKGKNGRFVQLVSSGGGVGEFIRLVNLERERHQGRAMSGLMNRLLAHKFDLTAPPLWRAFLARMGKGHHVLGIAFAHVIVDGYSVNVFSQDLARTLDTQQPFHPLQLGEVAQREQDVEPTNKQVSYWRDQYGKRTPLEARWDGTAQYRVEPIPVLPPRLATGVRELAKGIGASPSTVFGAVAAIASAIVLRKPFPMLGFATAQRGQANQSIFGPLHDHLPVLGGAPANVSFVDFVSGLSERRQRSRDNRLPTRILGSIAEYTPYDIAVNFDPFGRPVQYEIGRKQGNVITRAIPTIGRTNVYRATSVAPVLAAILRPRPDGALTGDITAISALYDEREVRNLAHVFNAVAKAGMARPRTPIGEIAERIRNR